MGVFFLNVYITKAMNASQVKEAEKTFLKCAWTVVDALSYLQLVSSAFNLTNVLNILLIIVKFSCRKRPLYENPRDCDVYVDRTDWTV